MSKELPPSKIPSAERIEAAIESAKSLPHITAEKIKSEEDKDVTLFGNNFYMLFLARRYRETNPQHAIVSTYLEKAEKLGRPWQDFLAQNVELIEEIEKALDDYEVYDELMNILIAFDRAGDCRASKKIEDRIDPKLGLNAIEIPVRQKLSRLLKKAAEGLRKAGINYVDLSLINGGKNNGV